MRVIATADLEEEFEKGLTENEINWIYNGLDCCITSELYSILSAQMEKEDPRVQETHAFALKKFGPIFEAQLTGFKIDLYKQATTILAAERDLAQLESKFQRIMREVFGSELNYRSPVQVKNLFYGIMALPEQKKRNAHGIMAPSTDREALEKLQDYILARPICAFILAMRDLSKSIGFLQSELDKDGRIRCNYSIAGTTTGRLNSTKTSLDTGTNLQNVAPKLRDPFVADEGKIMVNVDLEQADSRNVGAICYNLFYESHGPEFAGSYLDACESGDLHTQVCRMAWKNLDWSDDKKLWRTTADLPFYRGLSYRDMAKKLGHGTNYFGTPRTMAGHTKSPVKIIQNFQDNYFSAFPVIPLWHNSIVDDIKNGRPLYNLNGRRRVFWGRRTDPKVHREAVAYAPQSSTGEQIDRAWYQLWTKYPMIEFLGQVHDSITFQLPMEMIGMLDQILEDMKVIYTLAGGRQFFVPLEASTGWNWGYYNETSNPYGQKKWKGQELRTPPVVKRKRKLKGLL
jgi:DNA polymerase I-like protein with 3'-5' exonuclease and polymerase domains